MAAVLAHGSFWLPIAIFVFVFAGMFVEYVDKALVAAIGALATILLALLTREQAFAVIDFETLSLLFGMMVLVEVSSHSRIFELLSLKILQLTNGRPLLIFVLFILNTLVLSSFLNNVTTILIVLPPTVEIANRIGLNVRPFLIGEIVAANIGGLLTLVGDPVNTIIGSNVGIGMFTFTVHLGLPVFIITVITIASLWGLHRSGFRPIQGNFIKVLHNILAITLVKERFEKRPVNRMQLWAVGATLVGTVLAFTTCRWLGLTPGVMALIGAVIALTLTHATIPFRMVMAGVEWQTLIFFTGLFVVVGSLEQTGVLRMIADGLTDITTNPYLLLGILLLGTAVVSAVVDNIPFVTMMIPIMKALLATGAFAASPDVVWWVLSLGAVVGGMASPYGSSANIVAIGVARKSGVKLSTGQYLRYGIPLSALGLLVSYVYLIVAYEL